MRLLFLVLLIGSVAACQPTASDSGTQADTATSSDTGPDTGADTGEETDTDVDTGTTQPVDADGDGVSAEEDCDDWNAYVQPGQVELCNGRDDDCDGEVDEAFAYYSDADGDGYGAGAPEATCDPAPGWVRTAGDCDDGAADVHPGAAEICNGVDDDCSGAVDDGTVAVAWYADADGDGWGDPAEVVQDCTPVDGYVRRGGDCDDSDASVGHDCELGPDWDDDGDGYTESDGDCDDARADAFPGAPERCDAVDTNCDGVADPQGAITVNGHVEVASLEQAVAAFDSTTPLDIAICPGTYRANAVAHGARAVRVWGTGGSAVTVLDGGGVGKVFGFDGAQFPWGIEGEVRFEGLTVRGGNSPDSGGCLEAHLADVHVRDVVATDCRSGNRGGGLAASSAGHIEIRDSRFAGEADHGGGASLAGVSASVTDSHFAGEALDYAGGLELSVYEAAVLTRGSVSGTAPEGGGAIFGGRGEVRAEGTRFADSSAGRGGALFVQSCDVSVVLADASVQGARATDYGGGAYVNCGSLTSTNTSWGTESANTPSDVWAGAPYTYGQVADFTCTNQGCVPAP